MDLIDKLLRLDPEVDITSDIQRHCFIPFDQRWDGEGRMPHDRGIPIIREIHPRRWAEVMIPLDARSRYRTAYAPGLAEPELMTAIAVLDKLPPPAQDLAREAALAHFSVAGGTLALPRRGGSRQVNIRLGEREFEELQAAADIAGTSHTTLARWFLASGTKKVLTDHAAAYSAVRGAAREATS
jgi:hypothetical protein